MANNSNKFPQFLRKLREERQISQEELAALTGVSPRTVARWEAGESEPSREAVKAKLVEFAQTTSQAEEAESIVGVQKGVGKLGELALIASFGVGGLMMSKMMRGFLAQANEGGESVESEIAKKKKSGQKKKVDAAVRDPRVTIVYSVADVAARDLGISIQQLAESIQRIIAAAEVTGLTQEELVLLISSWAQPVIETEVSDAT